MLSSKLSAHMLHVILNEWLDPFIARIINIHGSGVPVALLVVAWLVPREMWLYNISTMYQDKSNNYSFRQYKYITNIIIYDYIPNQ